MNYVPSSTLGVSAGPATIERLLGNPAYFAVLQQGAQHLIMLYDRFPRVARLVSAQQKWLLSHAAFALHLERNPSDPLSGMTASRLLDIMMEFGAASRNTATAFLAEMLAYKFIRDVPVSTNKRSRPLEPTEITHEAMSLWFRGQMRSLDLLDNGNRVEHLERDPRIFIKAQPLAAKRLIADPAWRDPCPNIACFVWTEYGGLILDTFIARIVNLEPEDGRYWIDGFKFSELSSHFSLSRTHIRRLFSRAEAMGLLGWVDRGSTDSRIKNRVWLSCGFIEDYKRWQAIKFSALDYAYHASFDLLNIDEPARRSNPPDGPVRT